MNSSASQHTAKDIPHSFPLFKSSEYNILKHTVYTWRVRWWTLQVALGADLLGHPLSLLPTDVSPQAGAGVCLSGHHDDRDTLAQEVPDLRRPEFLDALEGVSVGDREAEEEDLTVFVAEGAELGVLVLKEDKANINTHK